ncbi:LOW QUALITY PROTEIN: protocadherin-7-like [Pomacea canaliculata]|uniref:LOW QUALITY PROTEIN: protocadherin-7-like n=1 Tax=Pomacea canaliculata TaxID=400727 RepID=UPI000D7336AF|nr:LOW QUALITY PROTEIN: protocadherin-7-like [Pomacea canaliculata]
MALHILSTSCARVKATLLVLSLVATVAHCQDIFLSYVIAEEQPKGTFVGNVAQDSNIRDHVGSAREFQDLTYSFLAEEARVTGNFRIDNVSGVLSTGARLDREQLCRFQMECRLSFRLAAQSSLGLFFKIIDVTVSVSDINDNSPTFIPSEVSLTIMENATSDFYTLPNAIDADTGVNNSVQEYSLLTSDVPFSLQVQGSTSMDLALALSVRERLDRETVDFYRLTVLAKDAGTPVRSGTLTVNVQVGDVNDHAPVWELPLYVVNVSEIVAVNTIILTLAAHDADSGPNGQVIYRFPPLQPDTALGLFALNETSGELRVSGTNTAECGQAAGRLRRTDLQPGGREARDGGTAFKSSRAQAVVRVLDTHNSRPEIIMSVLGSSATTTLSELADLGRVVAHILVRDSDSGLNGIVTCYLNATHFQLQAMDVGQYKVILSRPLDREAQDTHVVNVTCEDAGKPPLSDSKIFRVKVRDENDQAPVFSQSLYSARVTETGAYSSDRSIYVTTVTATDADVGENARLSYRILGDFQNEFYVFDNGTVVATRGLDRENGGSQRYLSVVAYDHGTMSNTATATILLTVLDVNDNPPVFVDIAPVFYVSEGVPLTSYVGNVTAMDADEEENAIVLYSLHPAYDGQVPFKVITDGVIKTNGTLDREKRDRYDFEIVAHDLGRPHLSSSIVVTVRILDINDNSPVFLFPNDINNTVRVPHTLSPNTKVATIVAYDADLGNNERLVFARDGRNGTKFFDVDPETGEVILVRPLSEKDLGEHWLVVVAHDQGFPTQLANQTMLYIQVYRGNHTAAVTSDSAAFRNTLLVIIIVVVTFVLSIVVIVTMVLIRHQDRQRRLYRAKDEEVKVEAHLRKLASPYAGAQEFDAATTAPDASLLVDGAATTKGGELFSGRRQQHHARLHASAVREGGGGPPGDPAGGGQGTGLSPRDAASCLLNVSHVWLVLSSQGNAKKLMTWTEEFLCDLTTIITRFMTKVRNHCWRLRADDNLSDLSCDASTSDSGRGGSDVEMHGSCFQGFRRQLLRVAKRGVLLRPGRSRSPQASGTAAHCTPPTAQPQYSTGTGGTWSSETTTSGSYTVGSQELAQDIDKLFFDPPNDVVV